MTAEKPIIRLWSLNRLGMIISHPSGVIYSNQVDGYANDHIELEGAFVPLEDAAVDQHTPLEEYFFGPKWRGHCYAGIDAETADFVDDVLSRAQTTRMLKVDRDKLKLCGEAWIWVKFSPEEQTDRWSEFAGFPSGSGVITWENSD